MLSFREENKNNGEDKYMNLVSYENVKHLFNSGNEYLSFPRAVANRNMDGTILVDKGTLCDGALFANNWSWIFQIGISESIDFDNELLNFIDKEYITQNRFFSWHYISETAKVRLHERYGHIFEEGYRNYYRYEKEYIDSTLIKKLSDVTFTKITANNIYNTYLENYVKEFWKTTENFLNNGIGFMVTSNNEVIAHCFSATIEDKHVDIEIQTNEKYRKKGLATTLSLMMINECLNNDLLPVWDCLYDNHSSNALAIKIGFTKLMQYPILSYYPK